MTIKEDKRKFSICIASGDTRYFKHMDDKYDATCKNCTGNVSLACDTCPNNHKNGLHKALVEAQRIANKTGKKVCVMSSVYNVFPDKEVK